MKTTEISRILLGVESNQLTFHDVLAFIDAHYNYQPIEFSNGEVTNTLGTNEGSAKVFSLAKQHGLNKVDTLKLFAEHYHNVQNTPQGIDHANIRNFMRYGWAGIGMPINALTLKN